MTDLDQPLITIPRPGGPRKPSSGKYHSADGVLLTLNLTVYEFNGNNFITTIKVYKY